MVKWFPLSRNQYLGFWVLGLVCFALQGVPYMLMPFLELDANPVMHLQEASAALNVCEKILGSLCIVFMTFVVREDATILGLERGVDRLGLACAVLVLLLNYVGWFLYFRGHQSIGMMLFFLVALPPLYYSLIGVWRGNRLLTVTGLVFGVVHVLHVWVNLKL